MPLLPIEQLYSENWGTYYLNRYYFSIQTIRTKRQVGLSKKQHELSAEMQGRLQQENLPAIFHEFFHYLHEVSTIAGGAVMLNRILMKTIFTGYLNPDPNSAESFGTNGKNPEQDIAFVNAWKTNEVLEGSLKLEFDMRRIGLISPIQKEVHFPAAHANGRAGKLDVPEITYSGFFQGKPATASITLGRYYIYECLAYETDQIIDRRQRSLTKIADPFRGTEYTVCRMAAQEIYPAVRQEIAMAAALLALQQTNSGHAFISIIQKVGQADLGGIPQEDTIAVVKEEVRDQLKRQRSAYFAQQDEYARLFEGRHQLSIAYTYIAQVNKEMYDLRLKEPCFELDWLLAGQYDKLLAAAPVCDYLYKFKPRMNSKDPEFDRDFMATFLSEETSVALKALIAFDHYFLSHRGSMPTRRVEASPNDQHRCPFYTCCHLKDRKDNPEICNTKPWRMYEVQRDRDKKYCWYSTGVLEAKGHSNKTDLS